MFRLDEIDIVKGLKNEDPNVIKYIYKNYYRMIFKMTKKFGYMVLEPEDIFQEGLTRTIINIRNNKYYAKSTIGTYLYSVCRNICLKEINKKKEINMEVEDSTVDNQLFDEFDFYQRLIELIDSLNQKCKKIIYIRFGLNENHKKSQPSYSSRNIRFEDIALNLEISADNARQRFKRCIEKIRSIAQDDKLLIEHLYN